MSRISGFFVTRLLSAQQNAIHNEVRLIYDFHPHLLTQQQIQSKSGALDQFWAKAKSQQSTYVPALQRELGDFTNPPFFLYDGAKLLLSLSDSPVNRKAAIAAFAHCDLVDLQETDYFYEVHRLAALNEDTTPAAFHILADLKFSAFIPQHVLTLGQDYALIYMLLPADPGYWLQPAIARLAIEVDPIAQKSLLLLLWYAQTDAADRAIRDFAANAAKPTDSRMYAEQLIGRKGEPGALGRAEALLTTEASIRARRRERLKDVSDEALMDPDQYTLMLMNKRK